MLSCQETSQLITRTYAAMITSQELGAIIIYKTSCSSAITVAASIHVNVGVRRAQNISMGKIALQSAMATSIVKNVTRVSHSLFMLLLVFSVVAWDEAVEKHGLANTCPGCHKKILAPQMARHRDSPGCMFYVGHRMTEVLQKTYNVPAVVSGHKRGKYPS